MISNTEILKRVYAKLDIHPETMCWRYTGGTNGRGYGRIYHQGKMYGVHRLIFEVFHGPIPKGKEVHHVCGVRSCCNPAHLELVSHRENVACIGRYEQLRCERLQGLLAVDFGLNLFDETRISSTDLRVIWGKSFRGSNVSRYLETLAFVFGEDFEWSLVEKGRGRRPSKFELRMSPELIKRVEAYEDNTSQMNSLADTLASPVEM